jgi:hypothetical protein
VLFLSTATRFQIRLPTPKYRTCIQIRIQIEYYHMRILFVTIFLPWAQGFLPTAFGRSASPYTTVGQLNGSLQPLKYIERRYTALERP